MSEEITVGLLQDKNNLGSRYNSGKLQWSLVDFNSLESMVRVLEFGAKKYSPHNWKKGLPITEIIDSMMRHLVAFSNGENIDPESGISHIGHLGCNYMFLSYMIQNKPELDNRYKKEDKLWQYSLLEMCMVTIKHLNKYLKDLVLKKVTL